MSEEKDLTQFPQEGENNPFEVENKENDNSTDPSPENNETDQTPSSKEDKQETGKENGTEENDKDKDKGLADHPRWKEREDDWNKKFNDQELRHTEELGNLREDLEEIKTSSKGKPTETPEDIPSWFGGDEASWKDFKKYNQGLIEKAEKNVEDKMLKSKTSEQKKIDDATTYMDSQISEIESNSTLNPESKKVDRNKLLKFVLDNDIVDTKGRWNYKVGWQLMRNNIKAPADKNLQERKKLAAATQSDKKAEGKPSDFMTSDDFQNPQNRPW